MNYDYIEVPQDKIYCQGIVIDPNTFVPCLKVIIDKNYYDSVAEHNFIIKIDKDLTEVMEYKKNNYLEYQPIEMIYEIGYQPEILEVTPELEQASKVISSMYHNLTYRIPIVLDVVPYSEITVFDVTKLLAKRYKDMLQDKKDIDNNLGKTSNANLLWMCDRILEDDSMPEDKISRWIGFIQGVMAVKGYTTVDEERDFSRPLFHHAYNVKNIPIPETQEME